jgi:hypothetical protein
MLLMAKKKKRGRPASSAEKKSVLHVEIPADLKDALEALAKRNRRPMTSEVEIMMEKMLAEAGLWPPAPHEPTPPAPPQE